MSAQDELDIAILVHRQRPTAENEAAILAAQRRVLSEFFAAERAEWAAQLQVSFR